MKLEIGMYVRTDNGVIGKIYKKIGDMFTYKDSNRDYITYGLEHNEILKASHNIIDLIEVGDYVNGHKVFLVKENSIRIEEREQTWGVMEIETIDIKTIVTKQQMESMQYEVK